MHFDIASKRLMEIGGPDILRTIAGLNLRGFTPLEELPQEQVWLTSCDFCALCTLEDGSRAIVLLEFQTRWRRDKLLDMLVYAAQRMRRHKLPVIQVMILLRPSKSATARFRQGSITFDINLVKMSEIDAGQLLNPGHPALWPLAALARDGLASAAKVDNLLHQTPMEPRERADLLSIFAIFLGMRDKAASEYFINKRRDLMIQSPVYEMIKREGREEGLQEGREEGREEVFPLLRDAIIAILKHRFGSAVSESVVRRLEQMDDVKRLRAAQRNASRCGSIAEFSRALRAR